MIVLGLETSGDVASLTLLDADQVLAARSWRHELQLSQRLVPEIEGLLSEAGLTPQSLHGIAVAVGPGSFTGLRVGVATAKTLAYALAIPVTGVSTLRALTAAAAPPEGVLCCTLLSATATECFGGFFLNTENQSPESFQAITAWKEELAARNSGLVLGGVGRHREALAELPSGWRLAAEDTTPSAIAVARLGLAQLQSGEVEPAHALAPRYLRLSTPEQRALDAAACPA